MQSYFACARSTVDCKLVSYSMSLAGVLDCMDGCYNVNCTSAEVDAAVDSDGAMRRKLVAKAVRE